MFRLRLRIIAEMSNIMSIHNKFLPAKMIVIFLTACNFSGGAVSPPAPSQIPDTALPASETPAPILTRTAAVTETPTSQPSQTPLPMVTLAPTDTPSPLACLAEGGKVFDSQIDSGQLPQPLTFRIYLPPCYDQLPDQYYPTLYLIHGQSFRQDQWDRLGVDETADAMISIGESAAFIIVMPRDRIWEQPDKDKFGEAVILDLIPYIDQTYRTIPDREYRGIGGLSRGASWAVHLGLRYWEMFGIMGAHSLPVFWSDVRSVRPWLRRIPDESMPRIYVDIATSDSAESRESSEWFVEVMIEEGIPHEWYLFVGNHNEEYWAAHMRQYLRFYTHGW